MTSISTFNVNPWLAEVLGWHGHDRGGVRVPFQPGGSPLGKTIDTDLILRLHRLADQIASGLDSPRWIFLVGGPGNGKSETIQDFLQYLDSKLALQGALTGFLEQAFRPQPIVKPRVEVVSADLATAGTFEQHVGKLILIQDATTTEDARGDAAEELAEDLAEIFSGGQIPTPLLIACVNRGVLARALAYTAKEYGAASSTTTMLAEIIRASSLGTDALADPRPPAWPLKIDKRVSCWPLDLESIVQPSAASGALVQILDAATDPNQWEAMGRCADCAATNRCPFRQNAIWLREEDNRNALQRILRRGELAHGQRWNFRDVFSLIAELLVGQWSDFVPTPHPCIWVHQNVQELQGGTDAITAAASLAQRLYPHVLFATPWLRQVAATSLSAIKWTQQALSKRFLRFLTRPEASSSKRIRETLTELYGPLDPAIFTPTDQTHPLKIVEDEYSQSIELGNTTARFPSLSGIELILLEQLAAAEAEWDLLGRGAAQAARIVHVLRQSASIFVKRSLGARAGYHANESYLAEYELSLRDVGRLRLLRLQSLLGDQAFVFDVVESFGQPRSEAERVITLTSPLPGIQLRQAPSTTESTPGHDVPRFEVTGTGYRVPITFAFYHALRLRKEGCANSSLPASVRASIDRVRHLYAGTLSRNDEKLLDGTARIKIGEVAEVAIVEASAPPILVIL